MTATRPKPHAFQDSHLPATAEGTRICVCMRRETSGLHKMPTPDPAAAAVEARRLGEREEGDK